MTRELLTIRGETYVTLEGLARCYEVEVTWIAEAYELGLLGRGERVGDTTAIAAAMLDELARILRLHRQLDLDLMGIATLLGERSEAWEG